MRDFVILARIRTIGIKKYARNLYVMSPEVVPNISSKVKEILDWDLYQKTHLLLQHHHQGIANDF
jgi:hypothetical protein